jgi:multidrug resistance efflux pump
MRSQKSRKSPVGKSESHSFTAPMQHHFLADAIESWKEAQEQTVPVREVPPLDPLQATPERESKFARRLLAALQLKKTTVIKSALAILVAAGLGWLPIQRMLLLSSADAFINARTIVVRAPISGEVTLGSHLRLGDLVASGDPLLRINNPRAEAAHLEDLQRASAQIRTNIAALTSKQRALLKFKEQLGNQAERYRIGRADVIASQISEIDAQIAAARAQYTQASGSLSRSEQLLAKGTASQASFDQAQRDGQVAEEKLNGLQDRRKQLLIERTAAQQGTFLTEGYSDASQSAQRRIDIEVELADIDERIKGSEAELRLVQFDIRKEEQRIQSLSAATVMATAGGRVWEVTASPGEFVNAGDVLMRLLDCTTAGVTAVVTESTYQKLRIGQQATFRPKDGGPDLRGWIADLSGLARVGRNAAIQPSALTRADYHVTLNFPDLESRQECGLSRSGLVVFD